MKISTPNRDEKIYEYVSKIILLLNDDSSVSDCDDIQCDNDECVLYKASHQYIKNNQRDNKINEILK